MSTNNYYDDSVNTSYNELLDKVLDLHNSNIRSSNNEETNRGDNRTSGSTSFSNSHGNASDNINYDDPEGMVSHGSESEIDDSDDYVSTDEEHVHDKRPRSNNINTNNTAKNGRNKTNSSGQRIQSAGLTLSSGATQIKSTAVAPNKTPTHHQRLVASSLYSPPSLSSLTSFSSIARLFAFTPEILLHSHYLHGFNYDTVSFDFNVSPSSIKCAMPIAQGSNNPLANHHNDHQYTTSLPHCSISNEFSLPPSESPLFRSIRIALTLGM